MVSNSEGELNHRACIIRENQELYGTYKVYWEDLFVGLVQITKEDTIMGLLE